MSPITKQAATPGGDSSRGLTQTSLLQFMSQSSSTSQSTLTITNNKKTTDNTKNTKPHKYNRLIQQSISSYFTPPKISPKLCYTPSRPSKSVISQSKHSSIANNLEVTAFQFEREIVHSPLHSSLVTIARWRQPTLVTYFRPLQRTCPVLAVVPPQNPQVSMTDNSLPLAYNPKQSHSRAIWRSILRYSNKSRKPSNKIQRYTVSLPTYDLFESWGHTLETIEVNSTFRVFLQNPNGLSVYSNNHLL